MDRIKDEVSLIKNALRGTILDILKTQEEEERNRKSGIIRRTLFMAKVFRRAKTVMFYVALRDEVDTDPMIAEAQKSGKIVAVPVCSGGRSGLRPCIFEDNAGLKPGPYGVREPVTGRGVPIEKLDLVVVPGVAFDKKGNRLGRGKGFYDRFLKALPCGTISIGLAFDFQIVPSVPTLSHDIRVHRVISA